MAAGSRSTAPTTAATRGDLSNVRRLHGVSEAGSPPPPPPHVAYTAKDVRAFELLWRYLTSEQKAQMIASDFTRFMVRGSDGHIYRIQKDRVMNVARLKEGQVVRRYCYVPKSDHHWDETAYSLPTYDVMLAQMLMLQAHARRFRYRMAALG